MRALMAARSMRRTSYLSSARRRTIRTTRPVIHSCCNSKGIPFVVGRGLANARCRRRGTLRNGESERDEATVLVDGPPEPSSPSRSKLIREGIEGCDWLDRPGPDLAIPIDPLPGSFRWRRVARAGEPGAIAVSIAFSIWSGGLEARRDGGLTHRHKANGV
jgi:hypothetical protein